MQTDWTNRAIPLEPQKYSKKSAKNIQDTILKKG